MKFKKNTFKQTTTPKPNKVRKHHAGLSNFIYYLKLVLASFGILFIGYTPHVLTTQFVGSVVSSTNLNSADLYSLQQSINFWNTFSAIFLIACIGIVLFKLKWHRNKLA